MLLPRPEIDEQLCERCGVCVKACPLPVKALSFNGQGAGAPPVYDYERCIRCYCCQEMCPHRAIERKTPFLGKVLLGRRGR
jgi:MinD superfamily P-loop ATPase